MTLPIIILIALLAGLAAAGAVWFAFDRGSRGRNGNRYLLSGAALVLAAAIVGGVLFAMAGGSSSGGAEQKVMEAIQRHHPEAAGEIAAARRERDPAVAQRKASELAQRFLPRHVPTTSDAAVLRFTREMTRVFENLAVRDSETCKALATGGTVSASFDAGQMKPALDAMAQIIDDSVDTPQPPPQPQQAQQLMLTVLDRVYGKTSDLTPRELLAQPAAVPAPQLCRTMAAIYREILELPPVEASIVLRHLMRGGTPRR